MEQAPNPSWTNTPPATPKIQSPEDYATHLGLESVESLSDYVELSQRIQNVGSVAISEAIKSSPSLEDKKAIWQIELDKDRGYGNIPIQYYPSSTRESMEARDLSRHNEHRKILSADLSELTTGTFKIDPKTGLSKLRIAQETDSDGQLLLQGTNKELRHLKRSTRKIVKKKEKQYKKLKAKLHDH